ncbi:MAG: NYN domain-containing protein [Clostridia bacterium]|nr:NYN domain-containing protein [Clostridia bacterium]
MEDVLIVDGDNIINSWPELILLKNADYLHARDRLVEILKDYQGLVLNNIIIVFDAYNVKGGRGSRQEMDGVVVVHTQENETADMYIEKLVGNLLPGKTTDKVVTVATSDRLEQGIIFGKGAYRVTPKELLHQIRMAKHASSKHMSKGKIHFRMDTHIKHKVRDALERLRRGD